MLIKILLLLFLEKKKVFFSENLLDTDSIFSFKNLCKKKKENDAFEFFISNVLFEGFYQTFCSKKKIEESNTKNLALKFFFKFLNKLGKKIAFHKKRIFFPENENLIYLNSISKFQIREGISRILSIKSKAKLGDTRKKNFKEENNLNSPENLGKSISLIEISDKRLRKIMTLYSIIKGRLLNYLEGKGCSELSLAFNPVFWDKNLYNLFPVPKNLRLIYSDFERNFFLKNLQRKINTKKSLIRVKKIYKKFHKKKTFHQKELFFYKIRIKQGLDSQVNFIHFFSLMIFFLVKNNDFFNTKKNEYKETGSNRENNLFNLDLNGKHKKKIENKLNKFDEKFLGEILNVFVKNFKKEDMVWKFFIFMVKSRLNEINLRKRQQVEIRKLNIFIEKLKKSFFLKKKVELCFQKQFRVLKLNSLEIDFWILKFLSLQRLFFYQKILLHKLFSVKMDFEEKNRQKKKKKKNSHPEPKCSFQEN